VCEKDRYDPAWTGPVLAHGEVHGVPGPEANSSQQMRRFHYPVRRKIAQDFLFAVIQRLIITCGITAIMTWAYGRGRIDGIRRVKFGAGTKAGRPALVIANNPTGRLLTIRGADT
jgi:hypothetical protein